MIKVMSKNQIQGYKNPKTSHIFLLLSLVYLFFGGIQAQAALGTGPGGISINFIQDEGSTVTQRNILNFIGSPINCVDNSISLRTDCTVLSSTSSGTATPLEVFSNFDATRTSPTASISIGDGLKLTVSGSTAIINIDFSSVTSRSDVILNQNTLQTGATFYISSGSVNGQLNVFNGNIRTILLPSATEAMRIINISSHQVFMLIQSSGTTWWRIGSDVTGLTGLPSYDIYNSTTGIKDISISTNDVITINGTMAFAPLTASRPLKLNASKQVTSGLIDLTTDVTGTLPSGNLPSNVVYTNLQQTISSSKVFSASQTFSGGLAVSTLSSGQCVETTTGGLLTTSGLPCGSGGGGSSSLAVSYNGTIVSSPTQVINFVGSGVSVALTGGATAQVTITGGGSASTTTFTTVYGWLATSSGAVTQTGLTSTPSLLSVFTSSGSGISTIPNPSTGQITVSSAGAYNLYSNIYSTGSGVYTIYYRIRVNGADTSPAITCSDSPSPRCSMQGLANLSAGDVVGLYASVSSGSQQITITDAQLGVFSIGGTGSSGGGSGTITGVTAGTNLTGGGTSGTVTLNVLDTPTFSSATIAGSISAYGVELATYITRSGSILLFDDTTNTNLGVGNFAATPTSGTGNTAIGVNAGPVITSGAGNTAVGNGALPSNQFGSNNTAVGISAVGFTGTRSGITGIGRSALGANNGNRNTALGYFAAGSGASGDDDVVVGYSAFLNATGSRNAVLGKDAIGSSASSADDNVAVGYQSFAALTTGDNNTGVGSSVAATLTVGSSNTLVGYQADVGSNNLNKAMAIGAGAIVRSSNTIQLGSGETIISSGPVLLATVISASSLATDSTGKIIAGSGGGGTSALSVGTGTATNLTSIASTSTAGISFLGSQFRTLSIGTTVFAFLKYSKEFGAAQAMNTSSAAYVSASTSEFTPTIYYDEASTQSMRWPITCPDNYGGTTLSADILFISSATSGTVNWGVYTATVTPNSTTTNLDNLTYNVAVTTSVTVSPNSRALSKATVVLSNTTLAVGDCYGVKLEREAGSNDSAVGYARAISLRPYEP